jgi:hypothetical protein
MSTSTKPKWIMIDDSVLQQNDSSTSTSSKNPLLENSFHVGQNPLQSIREAISDLYLGFIMTKTHSTDGYGIYKATVSSLSGNDFIRYLVAIVPNDHQVQLGTQVYLSSLPWICFQTRRTKFPKKEFAGYDLSPQSYSIRRTEGPLMDKISLASEQETKHIYIPHHLPLRIEILIQKEGESFAQESLLISALELFQTILILEESN